MKQPIKTWFKIDKRILDGIKACDDRVCFDNLDDLLNFILIDRFNQAEISIPDFGEIWEDYAPPMRLEDFDPIT